MGLKTGVLKQKKKHSLVTRMSQWQEDTVPRVGTLASSWKRLNRLVLGGKPPKVAPFPPAYEWLVLSGG